MAIKKEKVYKPLCRKPLMPRKLTCKDDDIRIFDDYVVSELIYRNPEIKLTDEEYRRLLVAIEAWHMNLIRYGNIPQKSQERLISEYIVSVVRAHREEIAKVTGFEISDDFLNCLPKRYRIMRPRNYTTAEEQGSRRFGQSFFDEADRLAESLRK
jgi:hypothetical protein